MQPKPVPGIWKLSYQSITTMCPIMFRLKRMLVSPFRSILKNPNHIQSVSSLTANMFQVITPRGSLASLIPTNFRFIGSPMTSPSFQTPPVLQQSETQKTPPAAQVVLSSGAKPQRTEVAISGDGLKQAVVGQPASFFVGVKGRENPECNVLVTGYRRFYGINRNVCQLVTVYRSSKWSSTSQVFPTKRWNIPGRVYTIYSRKS